MSVAINKKAYHDYAILETFTAGIVLTGPEVKSVKAGRLDLTGAFASLEAGEVWLKNAYIPPYAKAGLAQQHYNPNQNRKLLVSRKEINYLLGKTGQQGITLVPLKAINRHGLIKIELGLARGKHSFDKREAIKKRDFDRKKSQLLKHHH